MKSSKTKNFLITGAGRGIGRGLSRLLLERGHRVFMLDVDQEELYHAVTVLKSKFQFQQGLHFEFCVCDLKIQGEIAQASYKASEFFDGRIDCLINNAAHTAAVGATNMADLSLEDWNTSLQVNLTAPMLMSQACFPMLHRGSSIIHMSSTRAKMSEPDNEPYAATKAGLLGLTQAMAVSLTMQNIRVNAILPGWIHVANECKEADEKGAKWEDGLSRDDHEWHLTGRVGKVEDVLAAVLYLVDCDGVTGSEVVVDGGVTRKMVYPE